MDKNTDNLKYPFKGDGRAFFNNQPYLGGVILILQNITANSAKTIAHNLKVIPRQLHIIYSFGQYTPKWQATQAWDTQNIYIEFDTSVTGSTAYIIILVA